MVPTTMRVGHQQGRVRPFHGLQEQKPHALPLEHGLREDGEGDHGAQLHPSHRDHGKKRVLEGVHQPYAPPVEPLGPCEFDVLRLEDLHHLASHEPDEQGQHDGGKRDARKDQVFQPVHGEKPRLPASHVHRGAPAVGREPVKSHGEDVDEQDGGEKDRNRHPHDAPPHGDPRKPAAWIDGPIDPQRDGAHHDEDAAHEHQFEGGRGLAHDDLESRTLEEEGIAHIPPGGFLQKPPVLDKKRIVEAHCVAQSFPLRRRDGDSHQVPDGITDLLLDGKADEAYDQHDEDRLHHPAYDKRDHTGSSPLPSFPITRPHVRCGTRSDRVDGTNEGRSRPCGDTFLPSRSSRRGCPPAAHTQGPIPPPDPRSRENSSRSRWARS